MTPRRRAGQYVPRGARFTIAELTEAADRTERTAAEAQALAHALRYVRDRLRCDRCEPAIEIPIDRDGRLLVGSAYATHELGCPMV